MAVLHLLASNSKVSRDAGQHPCKGAKPALDVATLLVFYIWRGARGKKKGKTDAKEKGEREKMRAAWLVEKKN